MILIDEWSSKYSSSNGNDEASYGSTYEQASSSRVFVKGALSNRIFQEYSLPK